MKRVEVGGVKRGVEVGGVNHEAGDDARREDKELDSAEK